jgi:deoxyadenosine/deoxycytidine kinase
MLFLFKIVSLDGNIGSGKSTLLEYLRLCFKNYKNIVFLDEPINDWNEIKDENDVTILKKFYEDQPKYSFSFQMMAFISRLNVLKNAIKNIKENTIFITERSLFTDKMVFAQMLYDSGKMEYINYKIYLNWFDSFTSEFPIHKIIYIKTNPEICHFRVMKRLREGENLISLEYLDICNFYHEEMLKSLSELDICKNQLILDGNLDIYENDNYLEQFVDKIEQFIKD